MAKVFVVNKSAHDFSPAEEFGELVYLSEGSMNRYAVNSMVRRFTEHLGMSEPTDYILPCGFGTMNLIASAIFSAKHKRLNLLLFKDKRYVERNVIL